METPNWLERFAPYLGVVAALAFGVFISSFASYTTVPSKTIEEQRASSTLSVLPSLAFPSVRMPDLVATGTTSSVLPTETAANGTATTTSIKPHETPSARTTPQKTEQSAPVSAAVTAPEVSQATINASLATVAGQLRSALVNILCFAPGGSRLHSISGSGVIIAPQGIILTNAHVAQYFLLSDLGVSCTIRTGSPAHDAYTAEAAFVSPAWIINNANVLTEAAPSGTGEHDYAFLVISGSATDTPAPATFPYIPIAGYPPAENDPVVIGSYGAQFLQSNQIQSALFPTVVYGSVKDIFTFAKNTADVVSFGGSAAAQEGSSGGGAANADGALMGTITTSTVTGDTSSRTLRAITTSYIRAAYASETSRPLEFLLGEATSTAVAQFSATAKVLEAKLVQALGE